MSTPTAPGRRERKKAATRKAISDVATRMFLERGYDEVSIREIADAADVSPTTVFAHFPQKEALVFDEDDELRERLVAVVRDRPSGVGIVDALHDFFLEDMRNDAAEHGDAVREFTAFLERTPALRDYAAKMWSRHEDALATAVADEIGVAHDDPRVRVLARFVLQLQPVLNDVADPFATLDAGFAVLRHGWRTD